MEGAAPAVARPGRGRLPGPADRAAATWSDSRAERLLAASACTVLVLIAGMIIFVFSKAWPSFLAGGALSEIDERLLEIPLVVFAIGWILLGYSTSVTAER